METSLESELAGIAGEPRLLMEALRAPGSPSLLLDSSGGGEGWEPLVAVSPRPILTMRAPGARGKEAAREVLLFLEETVATRRLRGGPPGTGVAVLLGYESLGTPRGATPAEDPPDVVALAVDAAVRFPRGAKPILVGCRLESLPRLERARKEKKSEAVPASGRPRTSLPRDRYLRAVERAKHHIREGDVYQVNLTQRLSVPWIGDAGHLYDAVAACSPAPRSAFLEVPDVVTVLSASPETFLRISADGAVETWPIKGTRPRGADPAADLAAARELLGSSKDRAELVVIVDLERNDLGRVCRPGSVQVPELWALRSYAAVHHLVARVSGRLREEAGIAELLEATFPGGSITGAPKRRAIEILSQLEPVRRGFYTGSLFFFGDDGSTESSILIRTLVLEGGRAHVGAGGGIVADSEPEGEWGESNHKARALTRALGFEPEEAA
jgi:anthranilate/para-aminobenzoate synthase component I